MSEYAVTLPALPSMVGVARHAVAAIVGDDVGAEAAVRIVSELATNAIRHATDASGGSFVLSIVELEGVLRVAVDGPGTATSWDGQDGDFGRGLVIVDALADKWGTDVHEDGFIWWAEIWR
ncbi:ATP-binding protein [Actinospica robiniae]|uniref:ATP-binding protein n=1 Tax=Actinospica robiniae TaxID=304901 RepID=UPI0004044140|nr:ATP-binding protein [Actinospica robiniae]